MSINRADFAPVPQSEPSLWPTNRAIEAGLKLCGIEAKVVESVKAPQVATYHCDLANIMQLQRTKKALPNLSALLHGKVMMRDSSKAHFALEVPTGRETVYAVDLLFRKSYLDLWRKNRLEMIAGVDTFGTPLYINLAECPHLLVAGTTGSGKSCLLNSLLLSLLTKPDTETEVALIDPKQVEMSAYSGIPHLIAPVARSASDAVNLLKYVVNCMEVRYRDMAAKGYKSYKDADLTSCVVVIDELADLMLTSKKEVEDLIVRIAQKGRAAGIHLIVCTQRPSVDCVTGLIKANIPSRIALTCASVRDSMTILDHGGAENLTGMGDAILKMGNTVNEIRFQSAFCRDCDTETIVNHWRKKS